MSEVISVLMPVYNREKLVMESVDSILQQTYKDINLTIYDDGSTDKTMEVLQAIEDPRVTILSNKKNRGCAAARQVLLDWCNTRVACWHDSDDICNIHRLKMQYEALESTHEGMVLAGCIWMHEMDVPDRHLRHPKSCDASRKAIASNMFYTKGAAKQDLTRSGGGSDATWLRRMRRIHGPEYMLRKTLYYVRRHGDRIGAWKRNKKANPGWSKRMEEVSNEEARNRAGQEEAGQ